MSKHTARHCFEVYLLSDRLAEEVWLKLHNAILGVGGALSQFDLIFNCQDNLVRFFILSDRDLGNLSNRVEDLLLRPVDKSDIELPTTDSKERFVNFVSGGNLLDLKEKLVIKRGCDLRCAVFKVKGIKGGKSIVQNELYFKTGNHWSKATKLTTFFPAKLFAIDFISNTHYLKKSVPKYLDIEKSLHMLTSSGQDALFEVDTFPYLPRDYYLNLSGYEFDKHSFIIGATGSGKSKLISLYVDRLYQTAMKMNYRVVIVDPHASLAQDFSYLSDKKVLNFNSEAAELFAGAATDISAATELTATLFKSLLADQFNARLDRTLRFSLFVLFTAQSMSLDMLKRFLTDLDLRNQVLDHVNDFVPDNIIKFFGSDFNEIRTKHYTDGILPIVSLIDEMQLQPSLVKSGDVSLAKTVQDNFLTIFSLNKVSMGEKTVKTIAGLLIQQIFLLAQAGAFGQRIILIVDEVSVVQNPALASILAEARKFNLSVILSQQYFGQIEKDIRDAIFANVYNYYVFRVSEEDARNLEGNLNIELPPEIVEEEHAKGLSESDIRVKIMTELHTRQCLIRLSADGKINPCLKARTVDAPKANEKEAAIKLKTYTQTQQLPHKFVEQTTKPPAKRTRTRTSGSIAVAAAIAALAESPQTRGFSLSELLAQHSSSRFRVNKRKEKT